MAAPEAVSWDELGSVERAVALAASAARPGDTVLLAPAAASMDQFLDYSTRGDLFARAVHRAAESA